MLRIDEDHKYAAGGRVSESRRSEATLVCDFSEAELNRLLVTTEELLVTRLNDDEENIDFMAMYQ